MLDLARRFGGIARLYGENHLAKFAKSHICIVGIGGVGSWATEALVRSGIGTITMVDLDNISESNCNRQLFALDPHFGQAKVAVMAERMHAINPKCRIIAIEEFVEANNLAQLLHGPFDYLIDAIDHTATKALIATWTLKHNLPFIVCGGAGGRIYPQNIKTDDLGSVRGDPLLANMRYILRKHHGFSQHNREPFKIDCIYSDEPIRHPVNHCADTTSLHGLSCSGYGASMAVTASFGLMAAAMVTNTLAGYTHRI